MLALFLPAANPMRFGRRQGICHDSSQVIAGKQISITPTCDLANKAPVSDCNLSWLILRCAILI